MPVRMTGMISGMDTESLIKGMVDAQRMKNKKTTDKSTLLEWKQDKLKDLNAKLFKLYQEDLSKLRLQGSFNTKKVTSSNDKLVEVTANNGASTGANSVEVNKLASAQGVTSTEIKMKDGSAVSAGTKLIDLIAKDQFDTLNQYGQTGVISITYKGKDTNLVIDENTTVGDFVDTLKRAGLNASFDNNQKRLYISSKNSGVDEKFTITTSKIANSAAKTLSDITGLLQNSSLGLRGKSSAMATLDDIKNQMKEVNGITFNELYDKATDVITKGTTITGTEEIGRAHV